MALALDLAAVAVGSSIWLPLYLLITGTLLATTALVAEAKGADKPERIADITHQALWLALLVGIAGLLLIRNAWPLFDWLQVPLELRLKTRAYLDGVCWGMPAVGLFFVLRCYCEAQGRPLPVMLISVSGLLLNVLANQLFIYGSGDIALLSWLGIPAMGGPGCGWATALVLWQRYARNADGTPLFPLVFDPKLFSAALLLATLTGLLAAFAPALRAARLDPVVAIRG